MPKPHVTMRFEVTFPSDDPYLTRHRLEKALERLEPLRFRTWFPDPVRCLSCNQAESEEVRISQGVCQFCRQEQEPA